MRPSIAVGVIALLAGIAAPSVRAAEIVLEKPAVEKLLTQALFANNGRLNLKSGVCYAYLETPSAELNGGRVLSARLGQEVAGSCLGVGLASWTTVSGRPTSNGGMVKLEDIRIDNVDDPTTRLLLEAGLVPALPKAIELDVLKAVRTMLQASGTSFEVAVDSFSIQSVTAAEDRLAVKFDFRLIAR